MAVKVWLKGFSFWFGALQVENGLGSTTVPCADCPVITPLIRIVPLSALSFPCAEAVKWPPLAIVIRGTVKAKLGPPP